MVLRCRHLKSPSMTNAIQAQWHKLVLFRRPCLHCSRPLPQAGRLMSTSLVTSHVRGVAAAAAAPRSLQEAAQPAHPQGPQPSWEIKMLYDGDCPLCMREVKMLRARDAGVGKIAFVDVASEDYKPEENANITFEQAMGQIHAILADGRVVTNVEVFQRLYDAVGLGWVYAVTKFEPVRKAADGLYSVWAKYRLPITGRPGLEVILQERSKKTCK